MIIEENIENFKILFIGYEYTYKNELNKFLKTSISNMIFINDETFDFNSHIILIDKDSLKSDLFSLIHKIKQNDPYKCIILLTKEINESLMYKAFEYDVDSIIRKDDKKALIKKLEYFKNKLSLRNKNIQKRNILENILKKQSALVFLTDFKNITFTSQSFLDFFNISNKDELFERYENISDIFIPHDDYLYGSSSEILSKYKNSKASQKVVLLLSKDFNPKAFHITIDKIDENNNFYIITLSNISIMQEKSIETTYKAYVDSLTGVYNRNKFEELFKYEYKQFVRYKENFSICILDIDHFKKFNDTHGHLIGDEVLKILAQTINSNIRKADTFARWGGEEFVLLMPKTKVDEAFILCDKLREVVSNICHVTAGKITSSFGVTQIKDNDTLNQALKRCDTALYNAKAAGRNKVFKEI